MSEETSKGCHAANTGRNCSSAAIQDPLTHHLCDGTNHNFVELERPILCLVIAEKILEIRCQRVEDPAPVSAWAEAS